LSCLSLLSVGITDMHHHAWPQLGLASPPSFLLYYRKFWEKFKKIYIYIKILSNIKWKPTVTLILISLATGSH
jgi:hypothetical protein